MNKVLIEQGLSIEKASELAHLMEEIAAAAYHCSVYILRKAGETPSSSLSDNINKIAALVAVDLANRGTWTDIPAPELIKMVFDKLVATVPKE